MATTFRCAVLGVWAFCAIIIQVSASGSVWLKLRKFENPSGQAANGHCCDGRWGVCQPSGCDYMFYVCLGYEKSSAECLHGRVRSRPVFNHATYVFGRQFGGIKNPMAFHFDTNLTMPVTLKIDVYDRDALSRDEFVDSFVIDLTKHHLRAVPSLLVLAGRTRLIASSRVTCDPDWFVLPNCDVFCPEPSHSYMHYTCDHDTGQKVCDKGWKGYNCVIPLKLTMPPTTTSLPVSTTSKPVVFVDRDNADCDRLAMNGFALQDDVYIIHVGQLNPFPVFCDISAGGWTVIQQRVEGSESFYRGWDEYKHGFGEIGKGKDYWLGLEKIYQLTNQRSYKLRVTVELGGGDSRYAEYDSFWVEDESRLYRLHITGYNGTAGDALTSEVFHGSRSHRRAPFSTFDRDNDNWSLGSCAAQYRSGWWFNDCYWANLNGPYVDDHNTDQPTCPDGLCVAWLTIPGYEEFSLRATKMEILPNPRF